MGKKMIFKVLESQMWLCEKVGFANYEEYA